MLIRWIWINFSLYVVVGRISGVAHICYPEFLGSKAAHKCNSKHDTNVAASPPPPFLSLSHTHALVIHIPDPEMNGLKTM